jgi:DNA adenine methylase
VKPFLKWAGGKFRLVDRIAAVLPKGRRLIEPFVGSGAVFLNVDFPAYRLADANPDLIHLYRHLQAEGPEFIGDARRYFVPECNTPDVFYALRERFNAAADTRERAVLFVYLNRHGFNGLCRYNSTGGFNVPFGRYKHPPFPEQAMLAFHAKAQHAEFDVADFRQVMADAEPGDVVYCDPPYVPLTASANFTDYAMGGFSHDDQKDLADLARQLQSRGVPVVISNHDTPWTRAYYQPARIVAFDVQRLISADGARRAKAGEILGVFDSLGAVSTKLKE